MRMGSQEHIGRENSHGAGESAKGEVVSAVELATVRLLASCKAVDFAAVLSALRDGANPNGLKMGDGLPKASEVPLAVLCMEAPLEILVAKKRERKSNQDEKVAIAKALIDAGADPLAKHQAFEPKGNLKPIVACALIRAAAANHTGLIKLLAPYGKGARMVLSRGSPKGETAFLIAASYGNMEACRILAPLSNINARMNDGSREMSADALTLLSRAQGMAEIEMVEAIEAGWGDPNRRSNSGWRLPARLVHRGWFSALEASARRGPLNLEEVGLDGNSLLSAAIQLSDEGVAGQVVDWLLAHGSKPDAFNDRGTNAVATAIYLKRFGLAKTLVDAGADPSASSKDLEPSEGKEVTSGLSALGMLCLVSRGRTGCARRENTCQAVDLFESLVGKPDWDKPSGTLKLSPLNCAAINHEHEWGAWLTRRLLDLGADPDCADVKNGQTPLMHAMGKQNAGVIAALLPVSNLKKKSKNKMDAHGIANWLVESNRPLGMQMLQSHLEAKELLASVGKAKRKPKHGARSPTL